MPRESRTLTITIDHPARAVYDFIREPTNLPRWASGLADEVRHDDGRWIGTSDFGTVAFAFVPENDFLIADHVVTLSDGTEVGNPVRVLPNDEGADVILTVIREQGQGDEAFANVLATVQTDLDRLRDVLEAS